VDTALPQQHEALNAQVDDLQNDVAQATQQLSSLRASEASERQALDALRKQHQDVEASLARLKTQQRKVSAATPAPTPAASERTGGVPPAISPTNGQSTPPPPSAMTSLAMAQNALMRGRPDEARPQLALAETQLVLRPVTADQPLADGGNLAATEVSEAIRWLDVGNIDQALQRVSMALANARESGGASTAPAVPLSPGYYAYRPQSTPYNGGGWR
jgi:hypothetical protein